MVYAVKRNAVETLSFFFFFPLFYIWTANTNKEIAGFTKRDSDFSRNSRIVFTW